MKQYFKKLPFSEPVNEYLLSIAPSEFLLLDPSFDFRGRCRIYFYASIIEGNKK